MTIDDQIQRDGPRYALAIYDGDRHIGFLPWQGHSPVDGSTGVALDSFYSELGVRSQARRRALEFAPMTVAPYDLCERRPLDFIPTSESLPMPLKDEELCDAPRPDPTGNTSGHVAVAAAGSPQNSCHPIDVLAGSRSACTCHQAELRPALIALAKAQRDLVRLIAQYTFDGEV